MSLFRSITPLLILVATPSAQVSPELEGLKVAGIDKDGVAHRAGMKTGDTIVAINDKKVSGVVDIVSLMRENKAPKKVGK